MANTTLNANIVAKAAIGILENELTMANAPWNVEVYSAASPALTIDGWGKPVAQSAGQREVKAELALNSPDRYVLVMLREAARDKACSGTTAFRGGFAEISFASP